MKIKRSVLEKIVREELTAHIKSVLEAKGEDPEVTDAEDEKKDSEKEKKPDAKKAPEKAPEKSAPKKSEPKELDVEKDPADPELDKEEEPEEDAEDVTGGKIADDVTGKTVQSLTMEPKSKTLPGAQEIVITFREIPDPLKILITKTGGVKFFFKGLHNTLGEAAGEVTPMPTQAADPTKDIVTKKTNHADKFSMTNDEYLAWVKNPPKMLKITSSTGKPLANMTAGQIKKSLQRAAFMRGMAKGIGSDVDYWIAPIVRG